MRQRETVAVIAAIAVVIIGILVGYWVQRSLETAPSVPADRQNTQDRLPAAPATQQQAPAGSGSSGGGG